MRQNAALTDYWYKKLEQDGFQDIEDKRGYLKVQKDFACGQWEIVHSRFTFEYYQNVEAFLRHKNFTVATVALTKHGNCKFTSSQVTLLWQLHSQGLTTRQIAKTLGRVKSRIDDMLKGLRAWMKLL